MIITLMNLLGFKPKPYNPNVKTLQDAYETMRAHFLKQKFRAMNTEGDCMYRTDTGLMCAIGCLIPDKDYNPEAELNGVENDLVWMMIHNGTGLDVTDESTINFLIDAQEIHDDADALDLVAQVPRLDRLARSYGLDVA